MGGRGSSSSVKNKLGTINGEAITGFSIYGEETGDVGKTYTSLKDIYNALQELKRQDKEMMGYYDNYTINVKTNTSNYTGYKLKKYKNKLKLV